jgi:hypothetical protein
MVFKGRTDHIAYPFCPNGRVLEGPAHVTESAAASMTDRGTKAGRPSLFKWHPYCNSSIGSHTRSGNFGTLPKFAHVKNSSALVAAITINGGRDLTSASTK